MILLIRKMTADDIPAVVQLDKMFQYHNVDEE